MYDLEGRVALVTGASRPRGIGRAIALRLAREGADVVVADLPAPFADFPEYGVGSVEQAEAVAEEIRRLGRRALALPVDVTDSELVQEMVERALETFGRLDILVNNAGGVVGPAPVVKMEEAAWRKTLDINVTGTFLCSRAVAAHMIQRGEGGKIINIASAAAKVGTPWLSAYCAAKAAVIAFTRVLALELAPYRINVNAACPGDVDTDLQRWGWQLEAQVRGIPYEEVLRQATERIPLGRLSVPDDVANLVAFLASSESDYMTGQAVNVTGGVVMH